MNDEYMQVESLILINIIIAYKIHLFLDLIISNCGQPSYDKSLVDGFKFYISGLLTSFTGICGTVGNILSIATLLHRLDHIFSTSSM